jgi:hypothetical protein
MSSPHARSRVMARPACTPAAIRAVLAANTDADVLRRYDDELDSAFEQARERGDLTPLARRCGAGGSRPTPGATQTPSASSWPALRGTRTKGRRLRRTA